MIISCPACTKPYELEDQQIAPLVQIACPSCDDTIILDFEAANDPQLVDPGTATTLAFANEADYRLSIASSQGTRPESSTTKSMPQTSRPTAVPKSSEVEDESGRIGKIPPISVPHTTSPTTRERPPLPSRGAPPPPPSATADSRVSPPRSQFDEAASIVPPSPNIEPFEQSPSTTPTSDSAANGRRTMLMTSPMSPGQSTLPRPSTPPPTSHLSSKLPPPLRSEHGNPDPLGQDPLIQDPPLGQDHEADEIRDLEEVAEELPAAASIEAPEDAYQPWGLEPPSTSIERPLTLPQPHAAASTDPAMQPGQLAHVAHAPDFAGQLEHQPDQLPAKSNSTLFTVMIFCLVAIVVALLALCAFSLLQTGDPNPLPLLQSLGEGER